MSDTKKLLEAIEKLTEELKRANDRLQTPTYIPYPVAQPYPVYSLPVVHPFHPYNPPYYPYGIATGGCAGLMHNAVDMTDSYHQ